MLQVSITFDYLTKEGMGIILHFISFLLFNNHFQTSSVEELRSSINNIWWSLYWGKLLNPLEHKSLFRYTLYITSMHAFNSFVPPDVILLSCFVILLDENMYGLLALYHLGVFGFSHAGTLFQYTFVNQVQT